MKNKIIRFFSVSLFSAAALFLLGSVSIPQKNTQDIDNKEFSIINNSASSLLPDDFSTVIQKNPAILLEITVE